MTMLLVFLLPSMTNATPRVIALPVTEKDQTRRDFLQEAKQQSIHRTTVTSSQEKATRIDELDSLKLLYEKIVVRDGKW